MGTARPTVTKRQREQIKKDKRLLKAEKRAQRKIDAQKNASVKPVGDDAATS